MMGTRTISFTIRPSLTFHPKVKLPSTISQSILLRRIRNLQCCSSSLKSSNGSGRTPQLIKIAVSGITELLRIFSPISKNEVIDSEKDELLVSSVEDIVEFLKSDYERAYFVTGVFCSEIYAEDCIFEDPTIRFRGKALYERNLKLLVPFFDRPSIVLEKIEKGKDGENIFVSATWKLKTYLKLPWRPLISVDGNTVYDLDDNSRIVRHAESWNVSALEAIGQIFTPSSGMNED